MCYNTAVLSPVCPKFAYFASILLFAFASLFFQFFCQQNRRIPKDQSSKSSHHALLPAAGMPWLLSFNMLT